MPLSIQISQILKGFHFYLQEKQLCREIRIIPSHYLKMLQTIATEVWNGNVTKKTDAHSLFMVDPSKVDKVYDMVVEKGITSA